MNKRRHSLVLQEGRRVCLHEHPQPVIHMSQHQALCDKTDANQSVQTAPLTNSKGSTCGTKPQLSREISSFLFSVHTLKIVKLEANSFQPFLFCWAGAGGSDLPPCCCCVRHNLFLLACGDMSDCSEENPPTRVVAVNYHAINLIFSCDCLIKLIHGNNLFPCASYSCWISLGEIPQVSSPAAFQYF